MAEDDPGANGSWPPHDPNAVPGPAPGSPAPGWGTEPPPATASPPSPPSGAAPPSPPPPPLGAPPPPPPVTPPQWMPPPPSDFGAAVAVPPQWRSLRGLASALTVLFWLDAAAALFGVIALANRLNVINDFENGNLGTDLLRRAQDADDLARAAAVIISILALGTAVVFIIWMWRAAKNNEALGRMQPRLGPGWSIGGWFIPFANFVIAILIMQDLWRGSDPSVARGDPGWRTARGSGLVGWWWAAWLLSVVRVFVTSDNSDSNNSLSDIKTSNQVGVAALVASMAAAVLAVLVVRRLSERQEKCLRAQQAAWNAAQPGV
jgi:uncharacterized protein DUF4328